jgi:hypothetical protein
MINYLKKVGIERIYIMVNWHDWSLMQFFDAMGFQGRDMINLKLKI